MSSRMTSKSGSRRVPTPNATQLKFVESVQRTFAKQHFQQLRLDYVQNIFDPCNKIFLENVNVNEIDISVRNEGQLLLKEQRFDIFLHFMNKLVSSNQFAGAALIQSILELILSINWKSDDTSQRTSFRIQSAALLFEKILDNFPPLWPDCSNTYKDLLLRIERFNHLIAVSVNLSETFQRDKLITYPNIKRLTESFASEMIKSIESFPYTVNFYTNIIAAIRKRSPAVGMLVSLRILSKFTKEYENVSLRKIFDSISNESYTQYGVRVDDTTRQLQQRHVETYPSYDPKNNKKPSKHLTINRDEYLTLVLHLFESYLDVYRTHDLLHALLSNDASGIADDKQYQAVHEKVDNEKSHRLDFGQIIKDWKQLQIRALQLVPTDMIPVALLSDCRSVFLEASEFIRSEEDLGYLLKLHELVEGNVQLGDSFKKWHTAVKKYFRS